MILGRISMSFLSRITRRGALKAGLASAAATTVSGTAGAARKRPGETLVLAFVGDYWHNGAAQEYHWRTVLAPTGWRLRFARSAEHITPEEIVEADLCILSRSDGYDTPTWSSEPFVEERPTGSRFMTDAQEQAIVAGVCDRGMGLLSLHSTIWHPDRRSFLDLQGVAKPVMHTPVEPVYAYALNREHPITKGIEPFEFGDDEVFDAELKPGKSEILFKTAGAESRRHAVGGWCREAGKGRVVTLLPGHTQFPYRQESYQRIMWRSAQWALGREVTDPRQHA
jgi:type 1 glutamine amidotransferase